MQFTCEYDANERVSATTMPAEADGYPDRDFVRNAGHMRCLRCDGNDPD